MWVTGCRIGWGLVPRFKQRLMIICGLLAGMSVCMNVTVNIRLVVHKTQYWNMNWPIAFGKPDNFTECDRSISNLVSHFWINNLKFTVHVHCVCIHMAYVCECINAMAISIRSLVPRPSPKSGKRVWCSERHFLSHGAGPYFVKNVIIALLNLELEFLMPQSIWTTTQPGLQKLVTAAKSIGTAENRLWDKFSLFPIRFKIQSLTSCNYN